MLDDLVMSLRRRLRRAPQLMRRAQQVRYFGLRHHCPVCSSRLRRLHPNPPDMRRLVCPVCGSHVRHRAAWPYLTRHTNLFDGQPKKVLHFAPEREFAARLRKVAGLDYVSADLRPGAALVQADIRALQFPADHFDVILCSHVLEHIDDDHRSIRELVRVLRPGGWALIQVPLSDKPTDEDPAVTDPQERRRRYWQEDHVRLYGPDLADRLRAGGFTVKPIRADEFLGPAELARTATEAVETLFICTKPAGR